jgi:hypothetical protein
MMSIETNLLTTVQEVYFDLCDLQEKLYCRGVNLHGFEEFKNLDQFIDEQIMKLNYLDHHLAKYLNLENENA